MCGANTLAGVGFFTKLVNFTETLGILMVGLFIRLEDEYRK